MTAFGHADGWTRLPAGAIDKRKKHQKKKKNQKEKHQKKKKAEEGGGFIYSGRFCHSLYIIHGQERVGAFFH